MRLRLLRRLQLWPDGLVDIKLIRYLEGTGDQTAHHDQIAPSRNWFAPITAEVTLPEVWADDGTTGEPECWKNSHGETIVYTFQAERLHRGRSQKARAEYKIFGTSLPQTPLLEAYASANGVMLEDARRAQAEQPDALKTFSAERGETTLKVRAELVTPDYLQTMQRVSEASGRAHRRFRREFACN